MFRGRSPQEPEPERIFLYNPLHDYESIWWIAVWFVRQCNLQGLPTPEPSRQSLFRTERTFQDYFGKLSPTSKLVSPLEKMRRCLVDAFASFEKFFDGSKMLSIAGDLKDCLKQLKVIAEKLELELPVTSCTRTRGKIEEVGVAEIHCTEGEPMAVSGSHNEQSSQSDDKFFTTGKRPRSRTLENTGSTMEESPRVRVRLTEHDTMT